MGKRFQLVNVLVNALALGLAVGGGSGCRDSNASSGGDAPGPSSAPAAEVKDVVLPGVDSSAMTPRERHEWSGLVTSLFAPCPNAPVPVAQCVTEKRDCASCSFAAKWMAQLVTAGVSEEQIRRAYKDRFDPSGVKNIPIEGSPSRGPENAPVTIVEFADFECPHCREAVPRIDAVMAAHPGKIRLVYKVFTLQFHTHADAAARAALAAGAQGKFWEMEHLLFEQQMHLEDADLERYARSLKLDVPKWKADMESSAIKDRVAQDHKLGEDLKIQGTPTIYINGRELHSEQDETIEDRIAAELGAPAAPAPSAAATPDAAAPDAAPAPSAHASTTPSAKPR